MGNQQYQQMAKEAELHLEYGSVVSRFVRNQNDEERAMTHKEDRRRLQPLRGRLIQFSSWPATVSCVSSRHLQLDKRRKQCQPMHLLLSRVRAESAAHLTARVGTTIRVRGDHAFIEYADSLDAEDAIKERDGQRLRGDRLLVEWARDRNESQCFTCGK